MQRIGINFGYPTISANTSNLLTYLHNDSVLGKSLFFDGPITVDSSIVFYNCRNLFFTDNTTVGIPQRTPVGIRFEVYNSTLKGACKVMWGGITADDGTSKLVFSNDTVRGMVNGIVSNDGTNLTAVGNTFLNNDRSLVLRSFNYSTSAPVVKHTIERNQFITLSTGLDTPYQNVAAGSYGIQALNCMDVSLGNRLVDTSGNYFENLVTGIFYKQQSSVRSSFLNYHSRFKKINGFNAGSVYLSEKGSCIHIQKTGDSALSVRMNGNAALNSMTMVNADKGIVSDGATDIAVYGMKMDSVTIGVAINKTGTKHSIATSVLDNTYLGIQIDGAPAAASEIKNNRISTLPRTTPRLILGTSDTIEYAEAISVTYPSTYTNTSNTWTIKNNLINLYAKKGLGIHLVNVKGVLNVNENRINLTPPSSTTYNATSLHAGVYIQACDSTVSLYKDSVIGCGITYNRYDTISKLPKVNGGGKGEPSAVTCLSSSPQIRCCYLDSLRNGFQFFGNCNVGLTTINNYRIQGNILGTTGIGMVFRATKTTFSTNPLTPPPPPPYYFSNFVGRYIGSATMDNNNQFVGASSAYDDIGNGPIKIWVAEDDTVTSCISLPRYIYTGNLMAYESQSNVADCRYRVDINTSTQYNCSGSSSQIQSGNRAALAAAFEINDKEIARAEQVARGNYPVSATYPAAPWINARTLYEQLRDMPVVLTMSPVLDSFYNANIGGPFDQIREADEAFSMLADTVVQQDGDLRAAVIEDIVQKTAGIATTNVYEENERDMLHLLLVNELEGHEGLHEDEQILIETLAASCRYVAGTAVDKARFLYQVFHLKNYYDDDNQCEQAAMAEVNSRGINRQMTTLTASCKVYPNPTQGLLQVAYQLDRPATEVFFELRNMTGSLVRSVLLQPDKQAATADVSNLSDGIYHYRLVADGRQQASGKLLIQH